MPAQLKAIREVPFARLLCEMVSDMQSIQPWPMRKISDANQRQSCRNYPSLDLVAWKDPIARERTVLVKQGNTLNYFLIYNVVKQK